MTSYCAYNSPLLTPDGNGYSGDFNFPPNSNVVTGGLSNGGAVLTTTPSSNGVTIAFKGGGLNNVIISNSSTAVLQPNTQNIIDSISGVLLLPPALVSAQGDLIRIVCFNGPWTLGPSTMSQSINIGNVNGANLSGPGNNEVITLLCVVSGSPELWVAYDVTGNITIT